LVLVDPAFLSDPHAGSVAVDELDSGFFQRPLNFADGIGMTAGASG